jgi:hypothetical protein
VYKYSILLVCIVHDLSCHLKVALKLSVGRGMGEDGGWGGGGVERPLLELNKGFTGHEPYSRKITKYWVER